METTSGIACAIEAGIKIKLKAIGATSIEKAATSKQAHFNIQEQNWINYIAGGMFAGVKKTKDGKFYTINYKNTDSNFLENILVKE